MKTLIRAKVTLVIMLLAGLANVASAEQLTASVDRSTIAENETFTLIVKYQDGNNKGAPDFSPLRDSFDILGNNQSSQYMNTNGRITSFVQWSLTLAPKQAGKALIPPLSMGNVQSRPITMTVTKAQAVPAGAKTVFIETDISTDEVYVQEEFTVTLKLYFKESITEVNAADFVVENASIEELPRSQYQTTVGHSTYQVIALRFSVTPESSGTLQIPSYLWNIRTSTSPNSRFSMGSGRSTLHRVKTDAFEVNVKPRPQNYPVTAAWLPAKELTISEAWSDKPPRFTVGEPVTRTVTVKARGLTGEQLPPITAKLSSDNFKFYPDQPVISSDLDESGKMGTRKESMAIVPSRAGEQTLPAIELTWWDTRTEQLQSATLPARTVTVAPARATPEQSLSSVLPATQLPISKGSASNTEVVYKTQAGFWPWLCGLLLALNGLQLALWLLRRQAQKSSPTDNEPTGVDRSESFNSVVRSAQSNHARECRQALSRWCRSADPSAGNVRAYFIRRGASKTLVDALDELDSHLFAASSSSWQGAALAQALKDWNQDYRRESTNASLPALYPA
ncbi:MAG TPA: BatD family protein [Marinagarivorans sp.]